VRTVTDWRLEGAPAVPGTNSILILLLLIDCDVCIDIFGDKHRHSCWGIHATRW
jgi:hypothetical protein